MKEIDGLKGGFKLAYRPDVHVTLTSGEQAASVNLDVVSYDEWNGMKDYLLRAAFEFVTGEGPEGTEGHDIVREDLLEIVGGSLATPEGQELLQVARDKKIALVIGHAGSNGREWVAADHPLRPQVRMNVSDLLRAFEGRNYGAVALYMCNPGRHDLVSSLPVFYIHGDTKFDQGSRIPRMFKPETNLT